MLIFWVVADIDAWGFIPATAQEGNAVDVDAAGLCADHAFLELSAVNACKGEQLAAYVVEHLDGVAVESVDLITELEQGDDWIWVHLGAAVFQGVDDKRVCQFGDDQKLAVGGHEVAVHPHNVQHCAEVWVCHLREGCSTPVVQTPTAGNGQQIKAVVERHFCVDWPTDVAKHGHRAVAGHGHELGAHDSVADTVPVDAATVCAWACSVGHNAVTWAQEAVADA